MFQNPMNRPQFSTMPVHPELNPHFDFGRNIIPPTFNHGGRVRALREIAEMLRNEGIGEDKILAHINPSEARKLSRDQGFSGINPVTGLPQFGKNKLFGKKGIISKVARVVAPFANPKQAYKDLRKHAPTLGALAGTILGGPGVGSAIGGGLGGLMSSRKDGSGHTKPFSNALRGLGHGAIIGGIGSMLGGSGLGGMGMPPGINGPVQGQGGMFSGLSGLGNSISGLLGGGGNALGGSGAGLGGILGNLGISPIEALLAGTTLYGMSKSKLKNPEAPGNVREQIPDFMRPEPEKPRKKVKFVDRRYVPLPEDWNPETDPEHLFYQPYDEEIAQGYSDGGVVDGDGDGMADKIPAWLSKDEFVMPADVVAACGSGSSNAGAQAMYDFVKRVRSHRNKGGTKLPPKAKSLASYGLKMGRR